MAKMRGARVLVSVVLVVVYLLGVVAVHGVPRVSAADCVTYPETRSFSGDCYFDQNASHSNSCTIDFSTNRYSAGCLVFSTPQERPIRPVEVPAGCDAAAGAPNGFVCPPGYSGPFTPAPGYTCTYDDTNANYICVPLLPTGIGGCVYDATDETLVCGAGSPPPPAGGAPPCPAAGGNNLLCNGNFASAGADGDTGLVGAGNWKKDAGACGVNRGLMVEAGAYHMVANGTYWANGNYPICNQYPYTSNTTFQQMTTPPGMAGAITLTLTWKKIGNSIAWSPTPHFGDDQSTYGFSFFYVGTGQTPLTNSGQYSCADASAWNYAYRNAAPTVCTWTYSTTTGEFPSGATFQFSVSHTSGLDMAVDDLYLTATWAGMPSPSPSPSPSPGPGGFGGYDCVFDSANENYVCTPAGAGNPNFPCEYDPANENYVCNGPIPPGNPPASTNSPTSSPAPGASATPGRSGGTTATGGSGCTPASGLVDLNGHGRYLGCLLGSVRDTIGGVGIGLARALGSLVDMAQGVWAGVAAAYLMIGGLASSLLWFVQYVVALVVEFGVAMGAPPADVALLNDATAAFQIPAIAFALNLCAAVPWFAFALWVLKKAGAMANG